MTLLYAFTFCGGFQYYYFSFRFRNGKNNNNNKKKKTLPKLECADKKLLEESCVRNFRNPLFAKSPLFEILGHFQKLFWAKILGVRNFRVFEILGHLPYIRLCGLDILREKWLNCLQTVETLIRRRVVRCLIWVSTVCL